MSVPCCQRVVDDVNHQRWQTYGQRTVVDAWTHWIEISCVHWKAVSEIPLGSWRWKSSTYLCNKKRRNPFIRMTFCPRNLQSELQWRTVASKTHRQRDWDRDVLVRTHICDGCGCSSHLHGSFRAFSCYTSPGEYHHGDWYTMLLTGRAFVRWSLAWRRRSPDDHNEDLMTTFYLTGFDELCEPRRCEVSWFTTQSVCDRRSHAAATHCGEIGWLIKSSFSQTSLVSPCLTCGNKVA